MWHSIRRHPRTRPETTPSAAQLSGASAQRTANHPINGTAYGCFRKTDHTAADGNAYLRVESSTVFASRFAEAREVIAYAANSTASQITPATSAMR